MEFQPILAAMRRNKIGAILIGVQIAITLAILVNGLFIIEQRVALSHRPTGLDEANVFTIRNQWVGKPADMEAKLRTDLAVLRSLPGVIDATASNSAPLSNGGSSEGIWLKQDQVQPSALTAVYFMDDHALNALGLKLVAGRNFTPDEVTPKLGFDDRHAPSAVIMSKALADKLFPAGDALGKSIYLQFQKSFVPIVGIVDRLQVPWTGAGGWGSKFNDNGTLEPFHFEAPYVHYVVRTKPGQIVNVMKAAEKALLATDRLRILEKVISQPELRQEAYRDDHGLIVILSVVCAALVAVTAFGIVGLTSYWVAQRRRQIGIRRALGATKNAIVRYFQTENFMIAAAGAAAGVALALVVNVWMMNSFAALRLNVAYVLIGAVMVMVLGQLAVLWPALKAASIPPALATRGSI